MLSKDERGLVLVIVLGLVLLFVLAFAYFMLMSTREITGVKSQDEYLRAFYLAEAGLDRMRYDLDQDSDWSDGEINGIDCGSDAPDIANFYSLPYTSTSLAGGNYSVDLKNADADGDEVADDDMIWVVSTGTYHGKSRAIQARIISSRYFDDLSGNVTAALESEGGIDIKGSVEINGEIHEYVDLSFEDVFGLTWDDIEEIARDHFSDTYYGDEEDEIPFNSYTATEVTWINSPETQSQITETGWTGDGILIVDGDLKMTGGTFNGIIWVRGALIIHGNPIINGGIFVESDVTIETAIIGNPLINYDQEAAHDAFEYLVDSLPGLVKDWKEISAQ